ncbi:MAG TPA: neuraminidase-like domain-containing protein, partial [Terrimicrobiaceae bacterium]
IPASQLDWLFREHAWLAVAPDPGSTSVLFETWYPLVQLQQLRLDLALEDAAFEAILGAANSVAVASDPQGQIEARKALVTAFFTWLAWPEENLRTLLGNPEDPNDFGVLNAPVPDAYRGVELFLRLARAMRLLKRLGVTATQATAWCEAAVTSETAKQIRSAAKAKHDESGWQKLATPLQNALRDKQREALVSYLVARPQTWAPSLTKATASDLFSHFLIDVENSSCQLTSRIKQAISSVQLFTQRCLMGLEANVETKDEKWSQWTWMKNYRVWEANRKVWLYPENWIEPSLRDNKSPFFAELESALLQSELDSAAAEQALYQYLERLDQVARLELAGVYEDEESKVLHVFGRTIHAPHVYFYRRREGATQVWTPWVKLELDIEGDHIIPVVWNRKVLLIWPLFAEKSKQKSVVMPSPGQTMEGADRYWEIRLAWSEYQNGRWSGKNLSDPVTFAAYQGENNILFGQRVPAPQNTAVSARMKDDDNGELPDPIEDDDGGEPNPVPPSPGASTKPRQLVDKKLIVFKGFVRGDTLAVRGYLRRDYRAAPQASDSQVAYPFGEFRFFGCRKIITTAHSSQITQRNYALAPSGTKFDHMWFTQAASGFRMFDGTFPTWPTFIAPEILPDINEPSSLAGDPTSTLANKHDISVLHQTPWPFRLLAPHQDLQFV